MAYKVLGQAFPTALTLTDCYTVPSGKQTVVSTIFVCNQNATTPDYFRISVAVAGEADSSKQYIYGGNIGADGTVIVSYDTFATTTGITLAEGDVIRVYSKNGS